MRDRIEREVTINLVALRRLNGTGENETKQIRRYLLALTLISAVADIDLFLRSGCQLQIPQLEDEWLIVPRRGVSEGVALASGGTQELLLTYARDAVKPFKEHWPKKLVHKFDIRQAKKLLAKKDDDASDET